MSVCHYLITISQQDIRITVQCCSNTLLHTGNCIKNKMFKVYEIHSASNKAADVIRCRQMSYKHLFHSILYEYNFAESEPINKKEHIPTDRSTPLTPHCNPPEVDSLFKRTEQVVSLSDRKSSARQRQTCLPHGRGFSSKVGKSERKSKNNPKAEKHGKRTKEKDRQKTEG